MRKYLLAYNEYTEKEGISDEPFTSTFLTPNVCSTDFILAVSSIFQWYPLIGDQTYGIEMTGKCLKFKAEQSSVSLIYCWPLTAITLMKEE